MAFSCLFGEYNDSIILREITYDTDSVVKKLMNLWVKIFLCKFIQMY